MLEMFPFAASITMNDEDDAASVASFSADSPRPDQIRSQLEKIIKSRVFSQAGRMARFLRFTVEQALAGEAERLKEYTIGLEVFDRGPSYDPRVDPIVRVEARRLRAKLRRYYESDGCNDDLIIEYPTGSYAPQFCRRAAKAVERPSAEPRTIAILPFANLSAEPDNEYFSDGLTQDLIHGVTKVPGLRVVAWHSATEARARLRDARSIGERLGVEAVLEGSVRRSGKRLRVAVQLMRVRDGVYLWSENYDRELKDVFVIQDEISRAIVGALQLRLTGRTPATRDLHQPESPVYDLYLKGRFHIGKRTDAGLKKSVEYFEKALAAQPNFALGYAGLADAYSLLADYAILTPREAMPKAKKAALHALELDDTLAEAYTSLAFVQGIYDWHWSESERNYRRAIELNPSYSTAHCWYATDCLTPIGRLDEALKEIRTAQQLDPLSQIIACCLGEIMMLSGRYDDAIREYFKTLELDPHFYKGYAGIGRCYVLKGMYTEAIALFEKARSLAGDLPTLMGPMGQSYALAGMEQEARKQLQRLEDLAERRYVASCTTAMLHYYLGDRQRALQLLEQGVEQHESQVILFGIHPVYRELRSEPRFQALVERVGLAK